MKNLSMPIESSRLQLFSNHIGERSSCSSKTISIPSENSNDDILVDNIFSKSNCESVSGLRAILDKDSVCSFQSQINLFLSHISLRDILEGNILGRSRAPILTQDCDKMTIN